MAKTKYKKISFDLIEITWLSFSAGSQPSPASLNCAVSFDNLKYLKNAAFLL